MNIANSKLQTKLSQLPDRPGVYFFLDKEGRILYVGKATSLRDRVRSYFNHDLIRNRSSWIARMICQISDIKFEALDSALEALIVEANYIKKYQPVFNTRDKDNKSFNFVIITDEKYPRVLIKRERELLVDPIKVKHKFGPFTSGTTLKEALKLIRKIFPFRDRCIPKEELKNPEQAKPCFYYSIGLCPGVCAGVMNRRQYKRQIGHIKDLLAGRKKKLLKGLEKEMTTLAKEQRFEEAEAKKRQLYALQHIEDVSLLKREQWSDQFQDRKGERLEGFDIAHHAGGEMVGVMTVFMDGEPAKDQYRKFKIRSVPGINDTAAIKEVVARRLKHPEWGRPDLLVVDGGEAQRRAALRAVTEAGYSIPVVAVVKDDKHRPLGILGPGRPKKEKKAEILRLNHETHRFAITYHRYRFRKRYK